MHTQKFPKMSSKGMTVANDASQCSLVKMWRDLSREIPCLLVVPPVISLTLKLFRTSLAWLAVCKQNRFYCKTTCNLFFFILNLSFISKYLYYILYFCLDIILVNSHSAAYNISYSAILNSGVRMFIYYH